MRPQPPPKLPLRHGPTTLTSKRVLAVAGLLLLTLACAGQPRRIPAEEAFGAPAAPRSGEHRADAGGIGTQRGASAPSTGGPPDAAATSPSGALASEAGGDEQLTVEEFLKKQRSFDECERSARFVRGASRAKAWAFLKACLERGRVAELELFLDVWGEELRSRPDGTLALARVIASRGGNVLHDVELANEQRISLLDLSLAIEKAKAAAGRHVVFLGRVQPRPKGPRRPEAELVELRASTDQTVAAASLTFRRDEGAALRTYDETGRAVLVRLPPEGPGLKPGLQGLFLARFDGVRREPASAANATNATNAERSASPPETSKGRGTGGDRAATEAAGEDGSPPAPPDSVTSDEAPFGAVVTFVAYFPLPRQ